MSQYYSINKQLDRLNNKSGYSDCPTYQLAEENWSLTGLNVSKDRAIVKCDQRI